MFVVDKPLKTSITDVSGNRSMSVLNKNVNISDADKRISDTGQNNKNKRRRVHKKRPKY